MLQNTTWIFRMLCFVGLLFSLSTMAYITNLAWPYSRLKPFATSSPIIQDITTAAVSEISTKWPYVNLKNCSHKEFMNRGLNSLNTTSFPYPRTGLVSAPGSGNTWMRHLIESATGLWTGSVYDDEDLYNGGLRGEMEKCSNNSTVAIKAHIVELQNKHKCPFDRIVLIVRETHRAILSEYNRERGEGHTSFANKTLFKTEDWKKFVLSYSKEHLRRILGFLRVFREKGKPLKSSDNPFTLPYDYWKKILLVSYERVKKDPLKETERVFKFLGLPAFRKHCVKTNSDGHFQRPKASIFPTYCAFKEHVLEQAIQVTTRNLNIEARKFGFGNITVDFEEVEHTDPNKC